MRTLGGGTVRLLTTIMCVQVSKDSDRFLSDSSSFNKRLYGLDLPKNISISNSL